LWGRQVMLEVPALASAIGEARYALIFLPPVLLAAGPSVGALLPPRVAGVALLVLALGTWQAAPVPSVNGYREAAEWIAREAPPHAVAVFCGKRDGSFVFNMRAIGSRHDITTLRADKLLLQVAVRRQPGVAQRPLTTAEIADLLDRDGVRYVVAQDDFWSDLGVMACCAPRILPKERAFLWSRPWRQGTGCCGFIAIWVTSIQTPPHSRSTCRSSAAALRARPGVSSTGRMFSPPTCRRYRLT
jgi:hypothetical protein